MQSTKHPLIRTVVIAALAGSLSSTAHAQIGSGWTAYTPGKHVQLAGCGTYSTSAGVETFRLTCSSSSGEQRAEQRVEDEFSSGTRQFEGFVKVVSLGGTGISLKQTFQLNNGAFLMIAVRSGGTLYDVKSGTTLATGVIGVSTRVNTITSVSASKTWEYINGSLKNTLSGGTTPFHNKYGAYRLGSGNGPITVEWSNVRYWSGGTTNVSGGGGGGTTVSFEAENVSYVHSGTGASLQTDANCSNGQWISLDAENTGSWLEFTTPTIAAGTYSVRMQWKGHPSRGQLALRVDGTQVGGTLDQYSATAIYPSTTFGNVTFSSSGTHKIRLTVTGKNSAASNYILSADQFSLVAQ